MELTNLSWHLGAILFIAWLLWLVIDLRKDLAEVSQSLLPLLLEPDFCSADSRIQVSKSTFVRAARFLLMRELQPVCSAKLRFGTWGSLPSAEPASGSALQALQAIYRLKKIMAGSHDAQDSWAAEFIVEVDGARMTLLQFCAGELSRFGTQKSVTFCFLQEGQMNKGTWKIRTSEPGS